jgi:hypothetical protein
LEKGWAVVKIATRDPRLETGEICWEDAPDELGPHDSVVRGKGLGHVVGARQRRVTRGSGNLGRARMELGGPVKGD